MLSPSLMGLDTLELLHQHLALHVTLTCEVRCTLWCPPLPHGKKMLLPHSARRLATNCCDKRVCPLQAVVTSLPGEDKLTIAVTLAGRSRFLDRPKGELLERTLTRLQMNVAKHGAGPSPLCRMLAVYQTTLGPLGGPKAECWRCLPAFYLFFERQLPPSAAPDARF